jgi:antitoxin component of MazEF toxin-antitoxin module
MLKKLTPIGNSHGIIIDRAILQLLQIDAATTQLDLQIEGGKLVLVPVKGEARPKAVGKKGKR